MILEEDDLLPPDECIAEQLLYDRFFPGRNKIPKIFLITGCEYDRPFHDYFTLSKYYVSLYQDTTIELRPIRDYVKTCKQLGLIICNTQTPNETDSSTLVDISNVKCLAIPVVGPAGHLPGYGDFTCPRVLPDLELLSFVSVHTEYEEYECFDTIANKLLLECSFPRLKYLDVEGYFDLALSTALFSRLTEMKHPKELSLVEAIVDLPQLLGALRHLDSLRSLGITMICVVESVELRHVFTKLSTFLPKLQKLQVRKIEWIDDSTVLQPIGTMHNLEVLYLSFEGKIDNFAILCVALKELVRLTSLSLHACTLEQSVGYEKPIIDALKCFPNLTQLRLSMLEFDFCYALASVANCKNIEKLSLDGRSFCHCDAGINPEAATDLVKQMVESLPRLHLLYLCHCQFSQKASDEIEIYSKSLSKKGRKILMCCGQHQYTLK